MAVDVAELAARRGQHAGYPTRLGGQVDEVGDGRFGRGGEAVLDVLVPLSQDLQIQRDDQRAAAGGLGAVDQAFDEVAVAHHVELKPEALARVLGHVLDGADAHGRQGEGHAEGIGRAGGGDLTVGVLHAGQAGGCQRHGHRHRLADHGGGGAAAFHVDGDALLEQDALEVALVGAVGALGPAAAVGVVVEHARHAALGQHAQVFNAGDLAQVGHRL